MNFIDKYLSLKSHQKFSFFLLIIIALNSYLAYSVKLTITDQIISLLLSFGVYIYYEEKKIENIRNNKNITQYLTSFLILFFCLYRSLFFFNDNDKFIYCFFTFLRLALIIHIYSINNLSMHFKPIAISSLFIIKEILFIPLSIALTPISTFFTWFFLNALGYKAVVRGAEFFFYQGGINITFSCSGSDQVIFSVYAIIILNICFPLKNKVTFLKQFTYTILLTLLVNVIRLSILTIFVKTANADSFSIFDFMHGGNGSLVFSLISMFLCCESYKKIYLKT